MNMKLHTVTDANGRPLNFFMTAGQISDYTGAGALLDNPPKAQWLLGDRGYDTEWFRDALQEKEIKPCIPRRKSRLLPIKYDKRQYKRRNPSRSCSVALKTGTAPPSATIGVLRSSSPPSLLPLPWSSGCDQ
jgi:IS5 family transposase